ncbi:MAG: hypothetical protein A4E49_00310 [Methanosaeta sp. PtaU1.Bin112]|nr:MAG: hypothetical protein A4E49_00310 [Methanosaeta sp. PtaU1.Bin112]
MKMKSMEPSKEARKEMMRAARGKSKVNSFFISGETGEIVQSAWRDDRAWFPDKPNGTYEVHIRREPFMSYSMLQDQIDDIMRCVWQDEENLHESEMRFLRDMVNLPDDQIKAEFGFKPAKIAELRSRAREVGAV